jgi:hypothetical protein
MVPNPLDEVFNPEKLLSAIRKYRAIDLKSVEIKDVVELFQEFYTQFNLICGNVGGIPVFRMRKIEPEEEHNLKKDLWCPPAEKVTKIGRANDVKESVFYAALDPVTAVKEVEIKPTDRFSFAVYDLLPKENDNLSSIYITIPTKVSNPIGRNQKLHSMILSDFMFSEFTRQVGKGTEFQYKASCAIAKILFDIPHKDSLLYPSMKNYSRWNIALPEKKAGTRLKLKQVLSCRLVKFLDDGETMVIDIEKESNLYPHTESISYKTVSNGKEKKLSFNTFFKGVNSANLVSNSLGEFNV